MFNLITVQTVLLILVFCNIYGVLGNLNPRVPRVLCNTSSSSSSSSCNSSTARTSLSSSLAESLSSTIALQLSGGGLRGVSDDHDSDDELLAFAEESDIMVEVRGGSTSTRVDGKMHPTSQPLRISTYKKGLRQLKNSERRELRRQKRLQRLERKKAIQEEKSHQLCQKVKESKQSEHKKKSSPCWFWSFLCHAESSCPSKYLFTFYDFLDVRNFSYGTITIQKGIRMDKRYSSFYSRGYFEKARDGRREIHRILLLLFRSHII